MPDFAALRRLGQELQNLRSDANAIDQVNRALVPVQRTVNNLRNTTAVATAGMGALWGASLKLFADYEFQVSKIEGIIGIPTKRLEGWQDDLRRISRETGTSPSDIARGLYFTTSAGFREQPLDILDQSARLSAAGMGKTKVIVDVLTSAVNAYGRANLSASDAADQLTKAVELGKMETDAIAHSIGRAIPVAYALGVEFHQLAGMIAALTRTGTTVREAVVSTTQMMATILKGPEQSLQALAKVGFTQKQALAMIRDSGMFEFLLELNRRGGGDQAFLNDVFGNIRALRGVVDLLGANVETSKWIMGQMADAGGTADRAFGAVADTLRFKFMAVLERTKFNVIDTAAGLKAVAVGILAVINWINVAYEKSGPIGQWIARGFMLLIIPLALATVALSALGIAIGGVILLVKLVIAHKVIATAKTILFAASQKVASGTSGGLAASLAGLNATLGKNATMSGIATGGLMAMARAGWASTVSMLAAGAGATKAAAAFVAKGAAAWFASTGIAAAAVAAWGFVTALFAANVLTGGMIAVIGALVAGLVAAAFYLYVMWRRTGDIFAGFNAIWNLVKGIGSLFGRIFGLGGGNTPTTASSVVGLNTPLPVGPQRSVPVVAAATHEGSVVGNNSRSVRVDVGRIDINAPGADSDDIARHVEEALSEQFETAVADADGNVLA